MCKELLKLSKLFVILLTLSLAISCSPDESEDAATIPSEDPAEACLESGDIIVSNSGSDALTVFSSDGTFKRVAFYVLSAAENLNGIEWSQSTDEVLVAIDGVDRVVAISAEDCSVRDVIVNLNLTGTIRGIAQLATSNDILIVETNNIERFGDNGNRVTSGWPLNAQTGGTGIGALADGGFVHCSSTADVLRTYTSSGAQTATRASGIAATTDAMDCMELADGSIAATWSGTSDTVSIYSANLALLNSSYSNTAYIGSPGGMAQKENGNLLIVDRIYNHVVEITQAGAFVTNFGAGYLSTPEHVLVVP